MIAPQSSSLMAGRKGSIAAASTGWIFVFVLVVCLIARASLADSSKVYDIDLRTRSIADALNGLSEQTGVPVVFPYDLVKDRRANPVVGRYTLLEALDEMLKDTGLSGGFSDKGVVTVSLAESGTPTSGETSVPHDENKQNTKTTRAGKKTAVATFFASIAAAFSASAEDAADTNGDQTSMSYVVVTAEKHEERQQDVPIAMTVLDPQTLAENGQVRLLDYFASVPGLNVSGNSSGGGTNFVTIRGLSSGASGNPTVATVVDDVPTTSSLFRGQGEYTTPDIDPSDLARVEVLKGPQGTLYGADSLSGLIKYVTVDPSTAGWSGRAEVSGVDVPNGGAGYAVRAAVNIPVSETFALRLSGFSRKDPGYIDDLTTGQNNFNSTEVYGGHLAALWKPSENLSVKLSGFIQDAHGDVSLVDYNGAGQFPAGDLKFTALPGTTSFSTQNQIYSATVNAKVAGLDIVSITGYSIDKLVNLGDYSGTFYGTTACTFFPTTCQPLGSTSGVGGAVYELDYTTNKVSEELRVGSSIGRWLDWRLGGFFTHEDSPYAYAPTYAANLTTGAIAGLLYSSDDTVLTFSEWAAFGELTAHVTDKFEVELGGRESWQKQADQITDNGAAENYFDATTTPPPNTLVNASQKANAFTYQVTPKFTISPNLMVYGRVATGYRIGGINPVAYLSFFQPYGIPETYSPDRTTNYELGIKGDVLEHRLSFDAAAYYIAWKSFQINLLKDQFIAYTANAGDAKSEGVELSLEARPIQGLTVAAEGSFDNAVLTQNLPATSTAYGLAGDRLPYSMRFSGGLTVNQDVRLTNEWIGFVGAAINYVGSRAFEFLASPPPAQRLEFPTYTQVNLRTGARYESWLMNLYVNNVADKRGIVGMGGSSSVTAATYPYYATIIQPRTVGLSVSRTF